MDAFERFLFLRTVPTLSGLPIEVVRVIAAHARQARFGDGEFLHRQGQPATCLHYVVEGGIEIRRHGHPVRELSARAIAGGAAGVAGDDQVYDGVALGPTTTLRLGSAELQGVMEDHFVLLRRVLATTGSEAIAALKQLGPGAGFQPPGRAMDCPGRPLDLVERMAFLRQSAVLGEAHIEAVSDLASEVVEIRLPAGEPIWDVGETSTHFLMPLRGLVECEAMHPSQRFVRGALDSVGSIEALAGRPRWFRARVKEDLVALKVDIEVFYDVLEDHFEMAMTLLQQLALASVALDDARAGANA